MERFTVGWLDGRRDRQIGGQMSGWIDGPAAGWMDGRADGWGHRDQEGREKMFKGKQGTDARELKRQE